MTEYRFLEPLDVLFLRGNRLFGDPGSHGESLVPPWPSVAAGALRSRMLADKQLDWSPARRGEPVAKDPELGTPEAPGPFTVTGFWLARRRGNRAETLHPLPADLAATREGGALQVRRLEPTEPAEALATSAVLPKMATLATDRQAKLESGLWLTEQGFTRYLAGETPAADELVDSRALWSLDRRVGVGLETERRRAGDGKLFSVEAVAMVQRGHRVDGGSHDADGAAEIADYDVGFLAAVQGGEPPETGTLRLGGDGRAAAVRPVDCHPPAADYDAIAAAGRCRIVLTAPGIFSEGWRLPGIGRDNRFSLGGVNGRLVCAAVPRAEVVSGWDLARWKPKAAQRAARAGSVYWIENLQATPDALRKLGVHGLWRTEGYDAQRRAEGFNRFTFAAY